MSNFVKSLHFFLNIVEIHIKRCYNSYALKIQQYSIVSAASIVQHGAIAALQECDENVVAMREVYRERRDLLVKGLRDIGLGVAQPNGAFYVFPDISISGLDDETFAEELLMEERVAVTPGSAFGKCGVNHVRISYSVSIRP